MVGNVTVFQASAFVPLLSSSVEIRPEPPLALLKSSGTRHQVDCSIIPQLISGRIAFRMPLRKNVRAIPIGVTTFLGSHSARNSAVDDYSCHQRRGRTTTEVEEEVEIYEIGFHINFGCHLLIGCAATKLTPELKKISNPILGRSGSVFPEETLIARGDSD